MKETIMYKCDKCGESFDKEREALECEFNHKKEELANKLLNDGFSLNYINYICGFGWKLSDKQEGITKDNCFIISHWQCCDKPAYRITEIDYRGNVYLYGIGGWHGGYGGWKSINDYQLKKPYPKESLYSHH